MRLFWARGFDGTSMNDLAAATGMAKPGLYATFGDKQALYQKALARYVGELSEPVIGGAGATDPIDVVLRRHLEWVAALASDPTGSGGCMVVNTLVECAHKAEGLEAAGQRISAERRQALLQRLEAARVNGELPAGTDIDALTTFYSGQVVALAVMARSGADAATLAQLIDVAMTALPAVRDRGSRADETGPRVDPAPV